MPTVSWRSSANASLSLVPTPSVPATSTGLAIALADLDQRAEAADAGEHLGPHRALRERLDALDERVAGVDVDAGVAIGERSAGRRSAGGIGARTERRERSADARAARFERTFARARYSRGALSRAILPEMTEPRPPSDLPPPAQATAAPPSRRRAARAAPRRRSRRATTLWIAGAAIVIVLALHWLGPVLTPFLIGAILAYLGTPLVDCAAAARHLARARRRTVVVLLFGLLLLALFLVLVPLVQAEVMLAAQRLPELVRAAASARRAVARASTSASRSRSTSRRFETLVAENLDERAATSRCSCCRA